ncbi:indolepyruvate decarboxylase [Pseudidiomarina tainanensis]|uniref:Indolepyruvate decarboxylase n=2 Tax=Pseudidiomarina TaxID=2800384 RepID=A0A1I6HB46_9GAMM|nr:MULTISPECIES: thiamine pyrophosphate-binding protein [Pseudidiomarina]RZQ55689.1 indolepyruvate decarboxylase [Pseudidiomarina tainanensis]SFR51594.1 indolepyruvate decarboxylase [Pseudidiomarina maritima]
MQLGKLLTQSLRECGVNELFGIPGDFILPLLQQLQDQPDALPFYYLTHEPAAVYAADAAARCANRPAAIALTYGAGALNGVNAVAQAYEEYVPLIIIAGYPSAKEIASGLQIHHQAKTIDSQRTVFSEITCAQVRLDNPATVAEQLQHVIHQCQQQSRPVLIEVPRDAVDFKIAPVKVNAHPTPKVIDEIGYQQLVRALSTARRPVILSGVNVRRSGAQLALERLAEQFNIPLVTTLLGRASVDPEHSCYGGVFCGASNTRAHQLLDDADLILAMGVIYTDSNFSAHQRLIRSQHFYRVNFPEQPLKLFCTRLASEPLPLFEHRDLTPIKQPEPDHFGADTVVREIHQQLSRQRAIVPIISDVGDCLFASLQASPSKFLAPAYYASMGYAIPAALGVYVTSQRRPVVLVGDGAFLMTGLELAHSLRYGCRPIVVLFNNHKWDMIATFAPTLKATALQHWQFPQLAESMGIHSLRAHDQQSFAAAFAQAWADPDRAHLIDVWLPENSRTARLQQFAQTLTTINKTGASEV